MRQKAQCPFIEPYSVASEDPIIARLVVEDATVLRIGDAYERVTPWRKRRPQLEPGASAPAIKTAAGHAAGSGIDDQTRRLVETMAQRAGLELSPAHLGLLLETAPYAIELVNRIRRDLPWTDGQASVFSLPSARLH